MNSEKYENSRCIAKMVEMVEALESLYKENCVSIAARSMRWLKMVAASFFPTAADPDGDRVRLF